MTMFKKLKNKTENGPREAVFKRFGKDESGLAALEFVIVAPFLIALWLGFFSFVVMESTGTRVSKAAAVATDIASQRNDLNLEKLTIALNAADAMMQGPTVDDLTIEVIGIRVTEDGDAEVVWGHGRAPAGGFSGAAAKATVGAAPTSFPSELLTQPGFYVQTTARVSHKPAFATEIFTLWDDNDTIDFVHRFNFEPRLVSEIECSDCSPAAYETRT